MFVLLESEDIPALWREGTLLTSRTCWLWGGPGREGGGRVNECVRLSHVDCGGHYWSLQTEWVTKHQVRWERGGTESAGTNWWLINIIRQAQSALPWKLENISRPTNIFRRSWSSYKVIFCVDKIFTGDCIRLYSTVNCGTLLMILIFINGTGWHNNCVQCHSKAWQTGELATVRNVEAAANSQFSMSVGCCVSPHSEYRQADIAGRQVADRFLLNELWLASSSNWRTYFEKCNCLRSEDLPPDIETARVYIWWSAVSDVWVQPVMK